MKDAPAIYLGRIVSKENFRVFIYGQGGVQKLVESWDEYEEHMASGVWFAELDKVPAMPVLEDIEEKPKRTRRTHKEEVAAVIEDDFLPSE